ncbi:hypothetical protein BCL57_000288 [Agromyces flavus]|uniref:Uncharacterized protein n=1 Tax=Agromyces flavus TaxID=589382 RepID=A0A1H1WEC8_9MICO|nr:hypothetical protein [Agromyces flavus]MCP2366146.1 hypothetical protein [Agromyces flavus]SDS95010.1 hypothetical protein SAMN04489721_2217 [Agromyces flavus]
MAIQTIVEKLSPGETLRTYRYARLSIIGAVLLLAIVLGIYVANEGMIESVSASYYTPARNVFVGVLFAVCLAFLAISGSGAQHYLLNLAALMAPVVAVVPTPITSRELLRLSGLSCDDGEVQCVRELVNQEVRMSVSGLVVIGIIGLIAAVWISVAEGKPWRNALLEYALPALAILAFGAWMMLDFTGFKKGAHVLAAVLFFLPIALIAAIHAVQISSEGGQGRRSVSKYVQGYAVIGFVIALDVIVMAGLLVADDWGLLDAQQMLGPWWVFVGEAIAIGAFGAFWLLRTIETWGEEREVIEKQKDDVTAAKARIAPEEQVGKAASV